MPKMEPEFWPDKGMSAATVIDPVFLVPQLAPILAALLLLGSQMHPPKWSQN